MGREMLSSKVLVVEEEARIRPIGTGPTAVTGFVGITERGPVGVATLCTSPDEYEEVFGGFTRESDVALAARGYFENGGTRLWVVRTCHYADPLDASSAMARAASGSLVTPGAPTPAIVESTLNAPYDLDNGERLALLVEGVEVAAEIAAGRAVLHSAEGPFALSDGMALDLDVDGDTQRVIIAAEEFVDVAAATAEEVAALLNAELSGARARAVGTRVVIETDAAGAAVRLSAASGTAVEPLGLPSGAAAGTGNVARAGRVGVEELVALLAPASPWLVARASDDARLVLATVARGAAASIDVRPGTATGFGFGLGRTAGSDAGTTPTGVLEARERGTFGNRLRVEVRPSSSRAPGAFDLVVVEGTRVREVFRNLSLTGTEPRFVESIVNDPRTGSRWIRLSLTRPIVMATLDAQAATLSGGDDGLTDLDDNDFVGSDAAGTGLRALDRVLDLSILAVPGRATPTVHAAMVQYAEVERDGLVFPVLDPPAGMSAQEIVDYVERDAGLEGLSEHGAIYWPRVRIPNPSRAVFGSDVSVVAPPSGIIAGVYARTDAARAGGIYDAPAGIELGRMMGVLGFETEECLEERKRDLVFPHRINPLTTAPGRPRYIDGARVLKSDGNFPFVSSRRGVSYIERALKNSLDWVRHRNPTDSLLSRVDGTVRTFLLEQTGLDAFASRDPDLAYRLEIQQSLISVAGGVSSRVLVRVGLAMSVPGEFVVISVSQDTRAMEASIRDSAG